MSTFAYLSKEQILYLHTEVIEAAGGHGGVRDRRLLQSALARPAARLSADDQALEEVTMAAAEGSIGVEELSIWIEQRTRRE